MNGNMERKSIDIRKKKRCCGCSACAEICPQNCIEMKRDIEGFLYPYVNQDNCVSCGMCRTVCPIINHVKGKESIISSCIAYYNDEKTRLCSSSGGVFSAFATYILSNGGVVYGALFDESNNVIHSKIESKEELYKLRGSKYVQSNLDGIFHQTKKDLQNDRKVLFTGTACQISGLKHYLKSDYPNLYTIDVLCHGTPSPKLMEKYVLEMEEKTGSFVKNIQFRDKSNGWKQFSMKITFENSNEYLKTFKEDAYMKLFLSNICLRPSCYDCKFKKLNRDSDLSIGDAWGINKTIPKMDDDKGTSIILVHSSKGQELLNSISNNLTIQNADINIILPKTAESRHSVDVHPNRTRFFVDLNDGKKIEELLKLVDYENTIFLRIKRKISHIKQNMN